MSADPDWVVQLHDGVHSYLEPNPVFAATGVRTLGEAAAVRGRDGELTLLAAPAWDGERLRESARCAVVACEDVAAELARRVTGRVAVAGLEDMPSRFRSALAACELARLPSDRERAKTAAELDAARRAATIAERAYAGMLRQLHPGVAEHELVAALDVDVRRRGADDHFVLISSSAAMWSTSRSRRPWTGSSCRSAERPCSAWRATGAGATTR